MWVSTSLQMCFGDVIDQTRGDPGEAVSQGRTDNARNDRQERQGVSLLAIRDRTSFSRERRRCSLAGGASCRCGPDARTVKGTETLDPEDDLRPFLIEVGTRRVRVCGVTAHPDSA